MVADGKLSEADLKEILIPHVCSTNPSRIDLTQGSSYPSQVTFSGFNLNPSNRLVGKYLKAIVVRRDGSHADITAHLTNGNLYEVSLNLDGQRFNPSPDDLKVALMWDGVAISEIAILQPVTKEVRIESKTFTYSPPRVGKGDGEFKGHGPQVECQAALRVVNQKQVYLELKAKFIETEGDWSRAEGTWNTLGNPNALLFEAQEGWEIENVQAGPDTIRVRMLGHAERTFRPLSFQSELKSMVNAQVPSHFRKLFYAKIKAHSEVNSLGLIKEWRIRGDSESGNDIATWTRVSVLSNSLTVTLRKVFR